MMMNNGGQLPSQRPISITQICITGIMYLGQGNGDDFWFNVDQGRDNQVYSAHIGKYPKWAKCAGTIFFLGTYCWGPNFRELNVLGTK